MQLLANAVSVASIVLAGTVPSSTTTPLDPHSSAGQMPPAQSRSGIDVCQVAEFEELARLHEAILRSESSTAALARTALRKSGAASMTNPWDTFATYLDEIAEYQELYLEFTLQQAFELANAQLANFEDAEEARAGVFEVLGDTYQLSQSWLAAPSPDGTTFPTLLTSGSGSGSLQNLLLHDYSVPEADFSDAPSFVATALDPFNTNPLDGWFYSAEVSGIAHTGIASAFMSGGVLHLAIWPDTQTDSSSLFPAADVAYARHLDQAVGIDWVALLQFLRPAFDPPAWDSDGPGGGVFTQGGPCANVVECMMQAAADYEADLAAAYEQYSQHVDMAEADYEADAEANAQSSAGFFDCFSRAGWPGLMGGATYEQWQEYVSGFDQGNWDEYLQDMANAENNLRNAVCTAIAKFRDRIEDCIRDCPEWEGLGPYMDAWAAAQMQNC